MRMNRSVEFTVPVWCRTVLLTGILFFTGCQTIYLPPGMEEAGFDGSGPDQGTGSDDSIISDGSIEPAWFSLDEGLDFYYSNDRTLPLVLFALRVDISAGLWELVFTEPSGDFLESNEGFTMEGISTTDFLVREECAAAVNGGPFLPYRWFFSGPGQIPSGLYVWEGRLLEGPIDRFDALIVDSEGKPSIRSQMEYPFEGEYILGGFQRLLKDGRPSVEEGGNRTPRTALGISKAGRYLYLMVADGRRKGYSRGLTLAETAGYLHLLGSHEGLNMDGGGSSVMVLAESAGNDGRIGGRARIVNRPVNHRGFPERIVATHLGIRKKERILTNE